MIAKNHEGEEFVEDMPEGSLKVDKTEVDKIVVDNPDLDKPDVNEVQVEKTSI